VKKTFLALSLIFPSLAYAAGAQSAYQSADADLKASLNDLSALRQDIKDEQIPLAKELREVQDDLRVKRGEVARIQRLRDNSTVDLNRLKDNVKGRRDQIDYMSNLVTEYGRSLKVRVNLSEQQFFKTDFDQFDAIGNNPELSKAEKLSDQLALVSKGIDRIDDLIGGFTFTGNAITPDGAFEEGVFILVGPSVVFSSNASQSAGLALDSGAFAPSVVSLGDDLDQSVRSLAASHSGVVPLDATLGDALAIKREETTVIEHIKAGGIWIYPILLFAGLAACTALFKLFEIYSIKMPQPGSLHTVLKLLNEGKDEEALAYAKSIAGPAGVMLQDAVIHSTESKELIEEVMYERMIEIQPKLERLLPFISVTAATAPLMGSEP